MATTVCRFVPGGESRSEKVRSFVPVWSQALTLKLRPADFGNICTTAGPLCSVKTLFSQWLRHASSCALPLCHLASSRYLDPFGWLALAPQGLNVCAGHGLFLFSSRLFLGSILSHPIRVAAIRMTSVHSYMFSSLLYVVLSLLIKVLVSELGTCRSPLIDPLGSCTLEVVLKTALLCCNIGSASCVPHTPRGLPHGGDYKKLLSPDLPWITVTSILRLHVRRTLSKCVIPNV